MNVFPSLKNSKKSISLHQNRDNEQKVAFSNSKTIRERNPTNSSNNNSIKKSPYVLSLTSRLKPERTSVFYEKRTRDFDVKLSNRINIFYGLHFVQYEDFLHNGKKKAIFYFLS